MLLDMPWWLSTIVFLAMFTVGPIIAWFALCLAANLFGLSFLWNRGGRRDDIPPRPLTEEQCKAICKSLGIGLPTDKEDA